LLALQTPQGAYLVALHRMDTRRAVPPCGRVAGRWPARAATIADRTSRTPASRGDSRSGSWSRPDGRSGWTSWRPPSSARSRPSSGTRGCELRNLSVWWRPAVRAFSHDICPRSKVTSELSIVSSLVSIGAVGIHGPSLARSEPTRMASGSQLRSLNRLRAEALGDLATGIDASPSGEIVHRRMCA
jgi:hypothetical protein